ncbi:AAA family ATPase, partial [bacterium]|nr:AAA family ATPase [bacterium]
MPSKDMEKGRKIIFSGPPGSGKTRKLIEIFNTARRESREDKVLFLVPDSPAKEHIRDIIARHSPIDVPQAFSDRGIHSLYSYTKKIGGHLTAGKIHLHALINKWVDDNKINAVKNPVLKTPGGRIALERAISTLRSNGYNSESLGTLPKSVIGQNSALLTGLKLWEEWLSETGKLDELDILEKAVEKAGAAKWDTILIDGFTEFNPLQWKVIEKLVATTSNALVALDPKQIPSQDIYNKFIHLGFKEEKLDAGLRWGKNEDLRWLADVESWDIHSSKPDSCKENHGENRIKIIKAGNPRIEASQLAREVAGCIADGFEYKDIAILTPSLGTIHRVLKSEFSRAGIPIRFYLTIPLMETGPGNLVRQLLEIVGGNWDDRDVCSLLSNPVSGIPGEDASRANYVTSTKRRLGSMDAWLGWADKNAGEPTKKFLHKLAELSIKKEIDPSEFAGEIIRVAGDKIRASWVEFPDDLIKDEGWAWRAVESCLIQSANVYKEFHPESTPGFITEFLKSELSLAKGKPLDRRSECVNAVTLLGSRTWGIKVAMVCGLSRDNFPKKPSKNPFLPDELRTKLDPPMPSYDDLKDREEALFRIAVTRASDRITLSWPSTDSSGSPNLPSGPIEKLVEWILNGEEPVTIEHDPPGDVNQCVFAQDLASLALENKIDDPELIESVSADVGIPLIEALNSEKYESVTIEDREFLSGSATGSKGKPVSPTDLN